MAYNALLRSWFWLFTLVFSEKLFDRKIQINLIIWTTIVVSYTDVKSLQPTGRSGTRRWNLTIPYFPIQDDVIKWKHFPRYWSSVWGIPQWIFPAQRPVTQRFGVFFDLRLNKKLSEQPWGWWFETPSFPLWRHCNGILQAGQEWQCTRIVVPVMAAMWHAVLFSDGRPLLIT